MELLYLVLMFLIVGEVFIFILLNVPTPTGIKAKIARFLSNTRRIQLFVLFHLSFCIIAGLLWMDSNRMEEKYDAERTMLKEQVMGTGTYPLTQNSGSQSSPTRS